MGQRIPEKEIANFQFDVSINPNFTRRSETDNLACKRERKRLRRKSIWLI